MPPDLSIPEILAATLAAHEETQALLKAVADELEEEDA